MPPYDGRLSGRDICPLRRGVASSEAELSYLLEGVRCPRARLRCGAQSRVPMGALERGGDHPAGPRGVRMGRMLGFFESFTFLQIGRRPWPSVSPVALTRVCVFQNDFSTPTMVSLIVVPDTTNP